MNKKNDFQKRIILLSLIFLGVITTLSLVISSARKSIITPKSASGVAVSAPSAMSSDVKSGTFKPFYIYTNKGSRENHFVPSGFMPNGRCINLNDQWMENCYSEKTCLRIEYDTECSRLDQKWAGIYWLNPANNWGNRRGGFDLTGAKKLTFWARGQKGGEQIQEFTIGGIAGDYPDSDAVSIGPVILTDKWRQYTIDLRDRNLSYISGGFAWTTNEEVNPKACVFYLDEIRFE